MIYSIKHLFQNILFTVFFKISGLLIFYLCSPDHEKYYRRYPRDNLTKPHCKKRKLRPLKIKWSVHIKGENKSKNLNSNLSPLISELILLHHQHMYSLDNFFYFNTFIILYTPKFLYFPLHIANCLTIYYFLWSINNIEHTCQTSLI